MTHDMFVTVASIIAACAVLFALWWSAKEEERWHDPE